MLVMAVVVAAEVTPITQGITFAAVGGAVTVLTLWLTNRGKATEAARRHQEHVQNEAARIAEKADDLARDIAKEERDYARQDEVAKRAFTAAEAIRAKLLDVEDLGRVTHALVNSDKTAAMRDQYDALMVTLALMREVVDLKVTQGLEPTAESATAIATMMERIAALDTTIAQRLRQQEAAEAAVAREKAADAAAPRTIPPPPTGLTPGERSRQPAPPPPAPGGDPGLEGRHLVGELWSAPDDAPPASPQGEL